jgi:hypothetical protein
MEYLLSALVTGIDDLQDPLLPVAHWTWPAHILCPTSWIPWRRGTITGLARESEARHCLPCLRAVDESLGVVQ